MIHPSTELRFINDDIGYGVVATRLIPRGSITWARDDFDMIFTQEQVDRMTEHYRRIVDKYTFVDGRGLYVLCWDLARFVNHACDATCLAPGYNFEIAVRDIQPGEQLTDDYGLLNLSEVFPCRCGSPACRRLIRPDDTVRYADRWDAVVREAFPHVGAVEQPLWELIDKHERAEVEAALANPSRVASCRVNFPSSYIAADSNGARRIATASR